MLQGASSSAEKEAAPSEKSTIVSYSKIISGITILTERMNWSGKLTIARSTGGTKLIVLIGDDVLVSLYRVAKAIDAIVVGNLLA